VSFEWPWLLLGLLLVPLALAGYLLLQRRRMRYAVRFTNLDLLANVVERSPGWRRHLPPALALLALAALLTGIARPHATVDVPREQGTVVLAMDVSGSMTATDVEPSRLEAARTAAERFLDQLPDGFKVGLVSFSTQAAVLTRPTNDHEAARASLESLVAGGGTAIGEAIRSSVELVPEEGEEEVPFSVLLLSDGENTAGMDPLMAAEEAAQRNIPVYTIALGTQEGIVRLPDEFGNVETIPVPPDEETMERIAEETDGRFFKAPSDDDLRSVYEEIGSRVGFEQEEREITFVFAGLGGLLILAAGALSALWFNRIP
jgi:Ca-activated chloride channel homolog